MTTNERLVWLTKAISESRLPGATVLIRAAVTLGPRAFEILVMQAERMLGGLKSYPGEDFDKDARCYFTEALFESLDERNYLSCAAMDTEDPVIRGLALEAAEQSLRQAKRIAYIKEKARLAREMRDREPRRDTIPCPPPEPEEDIFPGIEAYQRKNEAERKGAA